MAALAAVYVSIALVIAVGCALAALAGRRGWMDPEGVPPPGWAVYLSLLWPIAMVVSIARGLRCH